MRFRIEQRLVEMAMNEKEIEISPSLDRTSYNILDDESAFEVHSLQQEDETEAWYWSVYVTSITLIKLAIVSKYVSISNVYSRYNVRPRCPFYTELFVCSAL